MEQQNAQQLQQNMSQLGQQQLPQIATQLPQLPHMMQQPPMMQQPQMMQQSPQVQTQLVKLETKCVDHTTYHPERLKCLEPEKKEFTIKEGESKGGKNGKGEYWIIPLRCNYGTISDPADGTFFYEGSEMTTLYGVKAGLDNYGKFVSQISFTFDERNPNDLRFLTDIDRIRMGCGSFIHYYKDKVGYKNFMMESPKMMEATGFKDIITRKQGKSPMMYCDLINYKGEDYHAMTPFTYGPECKVLNWDQLKGMSFKCIPLFRIKHIYIGGAKASIQFDIKSVVVTSEPIPYKAVNLQARTAERLAQERPDWTDSIEAQIAKNNMLNQDKLLGEASYVAPSSNPPKVDTNASSESQQSPQSAQSANMGDFLNNSQQPTVLFS